MLSKKMTFSLMSLITIFALAFVVSSADAADPFDITFEGRESITYTPVTGANSIPVVSVMVTIKSGQSIAALDYVNSDSAGTDDADERNLIVTAFDKNGLVVATVPANIHSSTGDDNTPGSSALEAGAMIRESTEDDYVATGTQREYVVTIRPQRDDFNVGHPIVSKVVITVKQVTTNDLTAVDDKGALVKTKLSSYTRVITLSAGPVANPDRPNVVSIQRLRPGSQSVVSAFEEEKVTGAFDVRIVFTEKPHDFKLATINVEGGTASNLVVGVPFKFHGGPVPTGSPVGLAYHALRPHPIEGMYTHAGRDSQFPFAPLAGVPDGADPNNMTPVPMPTGEDEMYHQYRVTITPHRRADMVKISIKEFHDNASPFPNVYKPFDVANKPNGREQLRLAVATNLAALGSGTMLYLPHSEGAKIPENGFYILAKNKDGSGIDYSHEKDEENIAHKQTPAQLLYNVRASGDLPNLETVLANNGIIDLVAYDGTAAGAAYISEVMWGTDASKDDSTTSQWVEIATSGAAIGIGENKWALWFYQANETPRASYVKDDGTAGVLVDRIGTRTLAGTIIPPATTGTTADTYWSIAGKGQSGRTGIDVGGADVAAVAPIQKVVSMYRGMVADTAATATAGAMKPGLGTVAGSWMGHDAPNAAPSVNFKLGIEGRYGASPGASRVSSPSEVAAAEAAAAAKAAADAAKAAAASDTSVSMPKVGQIYISEIMVAGGGTLPQWIEISNGSRTEEVNLSGWTITVDNAAADADVSVGASIKFTIPEGTKVSPSGQDDTPSTILVVTEAGRNNLTGAMAAGQVLNLWESNQTELILGGVTKRRYSLLSGMAFQITLAPPVPIVVPAKAAAAPTTAAEIAAARAADAAKKAADAKAAAERKAATDTAGNLGADGAAAWALPMSEEGGRSSIIRRHVPVSIGPAEPEDGSMMDSWALASETSFAQITHIRASSYYGAANDVGTPGFRAGGALPVELSHFRPARNKETGAAVITWSTQSELNNAGFFIKRSQQRDGEFKVINATMIAGAGTTSEKQFYTYTDTTAQPNVVYYYQIEDVSLDGNRQTLTRGIRLKGHVGAAGKATTTWGELKTSNE